MKKLLVPVDGSEPALHAVRQAIELARPQAGELYLLNVQPPIEAVRLSEYVTLERLALLQREVGEEALAEAKRLVDETGIPYRTTVEFGQPAAVIAEFARNIGCDGVVMGTRGVGTLGSLVLGSVAIKVVHLVNVPVVLVK